MNHHSYPARGTALLLTTMLAASIATRTSAQVSWTRDLGPTPTPRFEAAQAYDAARGVTVLFGGFNLAPAGPAVAPRDVWEWDGRGWTGRQPVNGPIGELDPAMGASPMGGIELYSNGSPPTLWRWDGNAWTSRPPTSGGIGLRVAGAMALDPVRNRLVFFGGSDYQADLAETYEWDGRIWTRVALPVSPAGRTFHGMAFDGTSGEIVLAGGIRGAFTSGPATALTDTWSYNGARWTRLASVGAYAIPGLVYDDRRARLVQVRDAQTVSEWINGAWQTRQAPLPVGAQCISTANRAVAFHAATGATVAPMPCAVPGSPATGMETWLYSPVSPASIRPFGAGCAGSGGVPLLRSAMGSANLPWVGTTLRLELGRAATSPVTALFAVGLSDTGWAGGSLPASLAPQGLPGCLLLVSPDALSVVVGTPPQLAIAIPALPAIVGLTGFVQAAIVDPPANAAGLVTSNGVALTLGGL